MARAVEPTAFGRNRSAPSAAVHDRLRTLGLAACLVLLWLHGAAAQSDPAFPAPSATNSPSTASSAGDTAQPGTSTVTSVPMPTRLRANTPLLPFTGNLAQTNGLRSDTASSLAPPLDRAPRNYAFTPSLGLAEEYDSNILGNRGGNRGGNSSGSRNGPASDFITLVQPGIAISGVTTRLQGSLSYHPEIDIYARHFSNTQINQNFGGSVLATLLPGAVFLDLRAYGGVTTNGAGGTSGTSTAVSNQETQTLAFSASPFAVHRFGGIGTGEVGLTLSRSSSSGVTNIGNQTNTTNLFNTSNQPTNPFATTNPYFQGGDQTATTYGGHAGFVTGEAFGRYNGTALASLAQSSGTGVLSNAARDTFTIDNGYGVTRLFTLLATVGYEHIRYGGTTPVHIDDEIWDLGFRLTLGPASTVALEYGHHDGFNSFRLNAALQPTARTRVFAQYSEGLDTDAEQLQNGLATADFDQLGNPVDHTTGAPLLLGTTGAFGAQNNLYRTKRLSLTGSLLQDRDVFSATVDAEDNRLVSSSGLPNQLGSNQGVFGSLNWSHELSPTLSLSSFVEYGVRNAKQAGAGTQRIIAGSTALVKALSETVSAQLRYSYNRNTGGQGFGFNGAGVQTTTNGQGPSSNYEQSLILLSATKSF